MANMQKKFAEATGQLSEVVDETIRESMEINARKMLEMEHGQFHKKMHGSETLLQNRLRLLGNLVVELQENFERYEAGEPMGLELRAGFASLEVHRQSLSERFFDLRESISETRQQLFYALKDAETAREEARTEARISKHNKGTLKEYREVFEKIRQ
eukprot:EC692565.1.p2 GENE.EC692565.1~~EC692565.1.p2  ORF type:complete len:172 (+),score=46.06 EC692565.1:46-516(+)